MEDLVKETVLPGSGIVTSDVDFMVQCFTHDLMSQLISLHKVHALPDLAAFASECIDKTLARIRALGAGAYDEAIYASFDACIHAPRVPMKALLKMAVRFGKDDSHIFAQVPNILFVNNNK